MSGHRSGWSLPCEVPTDAWVGVLALSVFPPSAVATVHRIFGYFGVCSSPCGLAKKLPMSNTPAVLSLLGCTIMF